MDGVQPVSWQQTEASCSESDGRNFHSYGVVVNVCVCVCVCYIVSGSTGLGKRLSVLHI